MRKNVNEFRESALVVVFDNAVGIVDFENDQLVMNLLLETRRVDFGAQFRKRRQFFARRLPFDEIGCGFFVERVIPSPIEGGDGNREFLALFRKIANA